MDASLNHFTNTLAEHALNFLSALNTTLHLDYFALPSSPFLATSLLSCASLLFIPVNGLAHYCKKHSVPDLPKAGIYLLYFAIVITVLLVLLSTSLWVALNLLNDSLTDRVFMWPVFFKYDLEWPLIFMGVAFVGGFFVDHFYIKEDIEPYLEGLATEAMRRKSPDKHLSDIRYTLKPDAEMPIYDFWKYVNDKKGIFLGLNDRKKPIYVPRKALIETHIAALGETGRGKGIASQMLLTQLNRTGSTLVIFDPKKEEFLYSVFKHYAAKQFIFIDLDARVPQFNPIAHLDANRLYPILESALALKDKGQEADHYRTKERTALRRALSFYQQGMTFDEWFKAIVNQSPELIKDKDGELNKLGHAFLDISLCQAMNGKQPFDLKKVLNSQGDVLYIKCQDAKSISSVKLAVKIVLMTILDEIERRTVADEGKHVEIMLDELKFILTERVPQALGSIRNKGGSLLLNYQSNGDLENLDDRTLDGGSIKQQIQTNATIKICFRALDERHTGEMSYLTGTVIKESRSSSVTTNERMVTLTNTEQGISRQEREALFTVNDFLSLPKRVAILIGVGQAERIYLTPVPVNKTDFPTLPTGRPGYLESLLLNDDAEILPAKKAEDAAVSVRPPQASPKPLKTDALDDFS